MNILIAPDSFKGSLSSQAACNCIQQAIQAEIPHAQTALCPMADGGEGSAKLLTEHLHGNHITQTVCGPMPNQRVKTSFGWVESSKLAIIDMASASGLTLVSPNEFNPMLASSIGTGELIQAAINHGAKQIWLGIGGSATMDLGFGAMQALGFNLLDDQQHALPYGAQAIQTLKIIEQPPLPLPPITLLCDVTNPLLGDNGAARIFGAQKGANADNITSLETGYQHFDQWWKKHSHVSVAHTAMGGSGGGIAIGLHCIANATMTSGIEWIAQQLDLSNRIKQTDLIISGEGCLDSQSLDGKVVSGIAKLCRLHNKPLWIFSGSIQLDKTTQNQLGVTQSFSIADPRKSLQQNLNQAKSQLIESTKKACRVYSGI